MEELMYLNSVNKALKQAYEEQKFGISKRRYALEETYRPLVNLLHPEKKKKKNEEEENLSAPRAAPVNIESDLPEEDVYRLFKSEAAEDSPEEDEYRLFESEIPPPPPPLPQWSHSLPTEEFENVAGLSKITRLQRPSYYKIGKIPVQISSDNILHLPDTDDKYTMTPGLTALLMKKNPNPNIVTDYNQQAYQSILQHTNLYRRGFAHDGIVEPYKTENYLNYIRPWAVKRKKVGGQGERNKMFSPQATASKNVRASGVVGSINSGQKIMTNLPVKHVYYNSPEELLDRLVILWGEIRSGNTNTNLKKEVVNILQELREGDEK